VTPLAAKIRDLILSEGPMQFSRFMDLALYDPDFGYYRQKVHAGSDPFGRSGDFFTAEQLQPVFGRLVAAALEELTSAMGPPGNLTVVELGAGRGEMAGALGHFRYVPVDVDHGEIPARFAGAVFSNEFFDALPVDVAVRDGASWREQRVGVRGDGFEFVTGPSVNEIARYYLARHARPEQQIAELHFNGVQWMRRIAERLEHGYVLTVDYGYPAGEATRFPRGTLMSYRKHVASEEVLEDPGQRDITSHVPFSVLQEAGEEAGLQTVSNETMTQWLMHLGESRFEQAIAGGHALQLKTLLYGMGETFRVLVQRKQDGVSE